MSLKRLKRKKKTKKMSRLDKILEVTGRIAIIVIFIFLISLPLSYFYTISSLYEENIEITDDVKIIADYIMSKCKEKSSEYTSIYPLCLENEVRNFVLLNVTYTPDNFLQNMYGFNNDVGNTLEFGGDCENQAILALSILKALNVSRLYIVIQSDDDQLLMHMCWAVQREYKISFYNCYYHLTMTDIRRVV